VGTAIASGMNDLEIQGEKLRAITYAEDQESGRCTQSDTQVCYVVRQRRCQNTYWNGENILDTRKAEFIDDAASYVTGDRIPVMIAFSHHG
jgi:hypothetical protein